MATAHHNQTHRKIYDSFDLNEELLKTLVFDDVISHDKSTRRQNKKKSKRSKNQNVNQSNQRTSRLDGSIALTQLILLKTIDIDFDVPPNYLSKQNPSFENQIRSVLPTTAITTNSVEQLRKIAILMHKIMCLDLVSSLWILYRKSGTGELQSTLPDINQVDTKVWPKEVQLYMKLSKFKLEENEENASLTFVNHCLCQLDDQREPYRQQLHAKKSRLVNFSYSSECTMRKLVQEGLAYQRLVIDRDIALVYYYHTDQLLHRVYLAQKPSQCQVQIYQHLAELQSDHEMTTHEAKFLEHNIPIYLASYTFERAPIGKFPMAADILDPIERQQLCKRYKEVTEQSRMELINVSFENAKDQKKLYEQQYNAELQQMWNKEKKLPSDQKLTSTMHSVIRQCSINISARIECFYKYKTQLFQMKANTK